MDTLKAGDVKIRMPFEDYFLPIPENGEPKIKISSESSLVKFLKTSFHIFYPLSDSLTDQSKDLRSINAHLAVPLTSADKFTGFLTLTERPSSVLFS